MEDKLKLQATIKVMKVLEDSRTNTQLLEYSRAAPTHFFPIFFFFVKAPNVDILFSSNHNIHKSSCGLCFWASDPSINRFY